MTAYMITFKISPKNWSAWKPEAQFSMLLRVTIDSKESLGYTNATRYPALYILKSQLWKTKRLKS